MAIVRPVIDVQNTLFSPLTGITRFFITKNALSQENQTLRARVAELEVMTLHQRLQQQLHQDAQREMESDIHNGTQVSVLIRPPFSPYDTLLIDRREAAINTGDYVFLQGVLIGEVEDVHSTTALVRLFSSSAQTIVVRVGGIDVEADGLGGARYSVTLPKDSSVAVGDIIVVPEVYNALFGIVSEIRNQDGGPFNTVYFTTPVALGSMTTVTVVNR
jgi:cell shape-determining protein MreC